MSAPSTVLPGDEEVQLREVVRDVVAREAPESPSRYASDGRRERLWTLAGELGWPAISIPESCDGLGLAYLTQAGLLEEAGAGLFPGPLTTTAVAAAIVASAPASPARDEILAAIAGGAAATFAGFGEAGVADLAAATTRTYGCVPDADLAAYVVAASSGGGGAVVAPTSDAQVLAHEVTVDPGRPLFTVRLDTARAQRLGGVDLGVALGRALYGAELVGVADRAVHVAIAHVSEREQFGRPIGAFQAVKHLLADAYLATERARSLVRGALVGNPADRPGELELEAAMAKAAASEAAMLAVRTGIQLAGALGTTAEHPLPWLLGRARVGGQLLGSATSLYALVGRAAVREAP